MFIAPFFTYALLLSRSNLTACVFLAGLVIEMTMLLPSLLQLVVCSLYLGAIIVLFFFLQLFYRTQTAFNVYKILPLCLMHLLLRHKTSHVQVIELPVHFVDELYKWELLLPMAVLILITTLMVYTLCYTARHAQNPDI